MKRFHVIALVTILASTISQVQAKGTRSEEKTKQALIQIERELERASLNLDPLPYDRYWADDFVGITNDGFAANAKVQHRAVLTSGKIKFESFEIDNIDVRVFGNAAIVTSHRKVKYRYEDREMSLHNAVTSFFSKRNGRWQKVGEQTNRLSQ